MMMLLNTVDQIVYLFFLMIPLPPRSTRTDTLFPCTTLFRSIDAGATRISVRIAEGGISRLEVEDDGCGMTAADMALALERHATSKLPTDRKSTRLNSSH